MKLCGRTWKFGDGLSVFDILPARYDNLGVNEKWDECATHLFEEIEPAFATGAQPGDIIIAGKDMGTGHSHYYRATILACKAAGIGGLFAESAVNLFLRGAIDQGLPVWNYTGIAELAKTGEHVVIDLANGEAENADTGATLRFSPLAPVILDILAAGNAFEWAKMRAAAGLNRPKA